MEIHSNSRPSNNEGGHSHSHHHHDADGKNLIISIFLNLLITIGEIIGGLLSNSLSLISDAAHNLSDSISMIIAYAALKYGAKKPDFHKTFGYKRIEIIAALFNSITLLLICSFIVYFAVSRFINPEKIDGMIMLSVAVIGLIANFVSVLLLFKDKDNNLNIKAAYLHLLGDTLSSIAVVFGGILIYYFNWLWLDPLLTIIIAVYIFKETTHVFIDTYNILMQSVPPGIDINLIKDELETIEGINNIHHIHIWNLSDQQIHFECHADFSNNISLKEADLIIKMIEEALFNKYGINHVTVQAEYQICKDTSLIH